MKTHESSLTAKGRRFFRFHIARALVVGVTLIAAASASAQFRFFDGFDSHTLGPDDNSSFAGPVSLGFSANFFGTTRSQVFVNNNGNVSFGHSLESYDPRGVAATGVPTLAPFFADVAMNPSTAVPVTFVTFGTGVLSGHAAFATNWISVGVFDDRPILNSFQLVLVDRSDIAAGDFDFEFNYFSLNWDTGEAEGGVAGRGGNPGQSAHIGYSSGGATPVSFEFAGSGDSGSFLNDNAVTGLNHHHLGTAFDGDVPDGRYVFAVRDGQVSVKEPEPTMSPVPEPSTYGLMGAATLIGVVTFRRKRGRTS